MTARMPKLPVTPWRNPAVAYLERDHGRRPLRPRDEEGGEGGNHYGMLAWTKEDHDCGDPCWWGELRTPTFRATDLDDPGVVVL